ncbi:UMP kinase [Candidatus Dependentiae bacterium]|nr:UMP kinase [Candidatus Dependentiae bacterium]MBU4387125.1 UMP kinase [Candidatus Dependentiae bacterium]MCG2756533.1 UMP kinase [Candidatus Dependentiae bacterium]
MEKIVVKISGELFVATDNLRNVIDQIKIISNNYNIGIVVGAGNIFRGVQNGKTLGIKRETGDIAGMVATMVNGLVLRDMLESANIKTKILTSIDCPSVADKITSEKINCAFDGDKVIIFVGGTGNSYFTTDTNAVLRGLQIGAKQLLKGTKVDGLFDKDPKTNKDAKLIKNIKFDTVLEKKLKVMDLTAIAMALENNIKIRIFNIFEHNSIIKLLNDSNFGSTIE